MCTGMWLSWAAQWKCCDPILLAVHRRGMGVWKKTKKNKHFTFDFTSFFLSFTISLPAWLARDSRDSKPWSLFPSAFLEDVFTAGIRYCAVFYAFSPHLDGRRKVADFLGVICFIFPFLREFFPLSFRMIVGRGGVAVFGCSRLGARCRPDSSVFSLIFGLAFAA